MEINQDFRTFCEGRREVFAGKGLEDLLVLPILWIQNYQENLNEIFVFTPKIHPDFPWIRRGIAASQELSAIMQQEIGQAKKLGAVNNLDNQKGFQDRFNKSKDSEEPFSPEPAFTPIAKKVSTKSWWKKQHGPALLQEYHYTLCKNLWMFESMSAYIENGDIVDWVNTFSGIFKNNIMHCGFAKCL